MSDLIFYSQQKHPSAWWHPELGHTVNNPLVSLHNLYAWHSSPLQYVNISGAILTWGKVGEPIFPVITQSTLGGTIQPAYQWLPGHPTCGLPSPLQHPHLTPLIYRGHWFVIGGHQPKLIRGNKSNLFHFHLPFFICLFVIIIIFFVGPCLYSPETSLKSCLQISPLQQNWLTFPNEPCCFWDRGKPYAPKSLAAAKFETVFHSGPSLSLQFFLLMLCQAWLSS